MTAYTRRLRTMPRAKPELPDDLRTARGVAIGVVLGALAWAAVIWWIA